MARKFHLKPYLYYPNGVGAQAEVGYTCRHAEVCDHYVAFTLLNYFFDIFEVYEDPNSFRLQAEQIRRSNV